MSDFKENRKNEHVEIAMAQSDAMHFRFDRCVLCIILSHQLM